MVNENLVGTAARGILAVGSQRDCEDWVQSLRQWLPDDRQWAMHFAFGALVDPQFEQSEFFWRQIGGRDLVVTWRHNRVLDLMGGNFEEQTFRALSRHNDRTGLGAFENRLRRFENQIPLGLRLVVTCQTILLKDRQNLLLEIDRRFTLNLRDGNGARTLGLRVFGAERSGTERRREHADRHGDVFNARHASSTWLFPRPRLSSEWAQNRWSPLHPWAWLSRRCLWREPKRPLFSDRPLWRSRKLRWKLFRQRPWHRLRPSISLRHRPRLSQPRSRL